MPVSSDEEEIPLEGSILNARQVRLLKVMVIVMGVFLVLGFALIAGTIVYQASDFGNRAEPESSRLLSRGADDSAPPKNKIIVPIENGQELETLDLEGDIIALHLKRRGYKDEEIILINIISGKQVRRIILIPKPLIPESSSKETLDHNSPPKL